MLFWIVAALLTLASALAVMLPLLRRNDHSAVEAEHDLAVYRDQLAELEREQKRGLISKSDVAEARAEIARRILRLDEMAAKGSSASMGSKPLVRVIAIVAVLGIPVLSWGLYGMLGTPEKPSQPLAARLAKDPSQASVEELVARAEMHLAANPTDARGWEVLAPIYVRLGRYDDAAAAYRKVIELEGATGEREAALGEVLVGAGGGIITAEAEAAFERALSIDRDNPRARFFIGMSRVQEGKGEEARRIWQDLSNDLPQDSPWRNVVMQSLASLEEMEQGSSVSGPSEGDFAPAQGMPPGQRREMIEGMVASLDAKLQENPDDVAGWRMLLRSFVVLGQRDEAEAALERAQEVLGAQSQQGKELMDFALELGLGQNDR